MHEWEKVCFTCEVEPEKDGKFFCSTSNPKCKVRQLVDKCEIPQASIRSGAPVMKQHTAGFNDIPLWKKKDNMSAFCRGVMKFPESVIRWDE